MPISPAELNSIIVKNKYNLDSIFADIDHKLISSELSDNGQYNIIITTVPDLVNENIKIRYLCVGWHSVHIRSINETDSLLTLTWE